MLPISQITDEKVALEIGLPDELLDFARMVNSGELSGRADVKVRLTADIDLTGHQWTPIGLGKAQFAGRFDGCGHTISAVTIQKKWPGNYGLFGYVTGAIQNVTVTGTIYNRSGEPHSAVGGIVGDLAGGVVRNCAADLVIDSNRRSLGFFAGGIVGLLHDLDFEMYPEEHCVKSRELMRQAGLEEEVIHATASHGYGLVSDIQPEHEMEKVLFATDELTGLIGAAALMRPSKSTKDMELKSLKKKFKDKRFAAGCSREVIQQGAEMLGWELDDLLQRTLTAMQQIEDDLNAEFGA